MEKNAKKERKKNLSKDSNLKRFFILNPVIIEIKKVLAKLRGYLSRCLRVLNTLLRYFFERFVLHEIIFKMIFLIF